MQSMSAKTLVSLIALYLAVSHAASAKKFLSELMMESKAISSITIVPQFS